MNNEVYKLKVKILLLKQRTFSFVHHSFPFLLTSLPNLISSLKTKDTDSFTYVKEFAGTHVDLFHRKVSSVSSTKLNFPHISKRHRNKHYHNRKSDRRQQNDISEKDSSKFTQKCLPDP